MLLPFIPFLDKADRADGLSRIESGETESELLDLFDALGATDEQMEYMTLYASARNGWVTDDQNAAFDIANGSNGASGEHTGMNILLDHILESIPEPSVTSFEEDTKHGTASPGEAFSGDKFSLAAVTVGSDSYLGRTCTGRITSGSISLGDEVLVLKAANETAAKENNSKEPHATSTVSGIFVNRGISRTPLDPPVAYAGDIITLAGVPHSMAVGDTLTKVSNPVEVPLKALPLSPPILAMEFGANDGPLSGSEGSEVTPTKIRNRLIAETDNNVTLTLEKSQDSDKTTVFARGELQLGILIEQMRREGFELVISPPKVMLKMADDDKTLLEPFEEVTVDVDTEYSGYIVSALTGDRKGVLLDMFDDASGGKTRLRLEVPSRGLLGFHSEAATTTRGSAIINHCFLEDRKHVGQLGNGLEKGKLISSESGKASHYALASLEARGVLFIEPGHLVFPGMIIGENAKQGDLEVNPVRAKATTNMRTQNKEERVNLQPPRKFSIEELLGYMAPDEMLEVTPSNFRLRKAELNSVERRKSSRMKKQQQDALQRKTK
jgi:GTP-binding protein